jgi:hypothetical protein
VTPALIVFADRDRAGRPAGAARVAIADVRSALEGVVGEEQAALRPVAPRSVASERITTQLPAASDALRQLVRCYRVVPDGAQWSKDPEAIAQRLRNVGGVESAYVKPDPALPMLPADEIATRPPVSVTERVDFVSRQVYLEPGPRGINAGVAWAQGALGGGVRIMDLEREWNFRHVDLRESKPTALQGGVAPDLLLRNHGTNVAGILVGDHNGPGVSGICPAATLTGIPIGASEWDTSNAIVQAANQLGPGDILLVELQRRPGEEEVAGSRGYVALEWWPDDLEAIRYATGQGIIVVEAAGNGSVRLDTYDDPSREQFPDPVGWNPFQRRDGQDSGAILVGAGAPPPVPHGDGEVIYSGRDRSRLAFSNWGESVDAQGWGLEVTTTGGLGNRPGDLFGNGNEDYWYTDQFNGTSSAAPMIVGALACVQSLLAARGRRRLVPYEARQALRETGWAQQPAAGAAQVTERIGPRPDVGALINWALEVTRFPARPAPAARPPRRRRRRMRVTIQITDDDEGLTMTSGSGGTRVASTELPSLDVAKIRGPDFLDVVLRSGDVVPVQITRELAEGLMPIVQDVLEGKGSKAAAAQQAS